MPITVPRPVPAAAPAPISCETAVRRLWDYLDGGLAAPARAEVDAHLAACDECPPHFDFSRRVKVALAAAGGAAPGDDALRARVRGALRVAAAG
jgi:anti-sigma factor (TIGR02949 family)